MSADNDNSIGLTANGFSIHLPSGIRTILWNEVQEINAYKKDMMVYDLICLDIILKSSVITIQEEFKGWTEFMIEMSRVFPTINLDWYFNIMNPAFETNFTTLYKR